MWKFTRFSQLIKVHDCQDTITSYHETCHPSKSDLSEAEPILSKDGNHGPYEKSSGTDGDLLPQEGFPYKSDVGVRRLQILVSLRLFGTESN